MGVINVLDKHVAELIAAGELEVVGGQVGVAQRRDHGGLNRHVSHGVAVGISAAHSLEAHGAGSAGLVLNHHRGADGLLQLGSEDTAGGIGSAAIRLA